MNKTYYPTTMPLAMLYKSVSYCMSAASSYAVAATFNDEQGERQHISIKRIIASTISLLSEVCVCIYFAGFFVFVVFSAIQVVAWQRRASECLDLEKAESAFSKTKRVAPPLNNTIIQATKSERNQHNGTQNNTPS